MQRLDGHPSPIDAAPPGPGRADPPGGAARARRRACAGATSCGTARSRSSPCTAPRCSRGAGSGRPRRPAPRRPPTDPVIVSIFLDGGNDGLNTLVPITGADYSAYAAKRPYVGLNPANCLPLGGPAATPDWAWNPAATGFQSLYDAGKMAVIPAVDYMPPDMSHFNSRAYWQAGELDPDPATGWLGRWIDQNGAADNPLQAISAGLVAGRLLKSDDEPGGGAVQRRRRAVLDEQRLGRSAADGGLAGRPGRPHAAQRRHGRGRPVGGRRRDGGQPPRRPDPAVGTAQRARLRAAPISTGGWRTWPGCSTRVWACGSPACPTTTAGTSTTRRWPGRRTT